MTGIGGQITIDSAVGQGTVVRVVLPSHRELVVAGAVEPPGGSTPEARDGAAG